MSPSEVCPSTSCTRRQSFSSSAAMGSTVVWVDVGGTAAAGGGRVAAHGAPAAGVAAPSAGGAQRPSQPAAWSPTGPAPMAALDARRLLGVGG
eukprot:CAMPEP_0171156488 /NCGR_PEP_ID=MMETSP0790-20130122/1463_1 /TAXON_ID=2925 /ORGANISM="Alexandrium catenella, Strain OF101" /LENGTH=92 /DNA_ID=CAMNT_0011620783 /DNA_START=463 /DNA_END=738 /DNA_ORIENTATION=+